MSKKHRKKASEIFRETDYPFSHKVSFKKAFPQIKAAIVKVEETGNLGLGLCFESVKAASFNEQSLGEYIDCSNPACRNGGFSIGEIFREMEREKKTRFETLEGCIGFEGSPRFKENQHQCLNHFNVTVDVEYI